MGVNARAGGCPACAEPVGRGDRFCEACGNSLLRRGSTSAEAATKDVVRKCPACGTVSGTTTGYCDECGLRLPDPADRTTIDLGALAGVSDRGLVHHRNEDAIALGRLLDGTTAAVVCDGVSTTRQPERAARAASEAALAVLLGVDAPVEPVSRVRAAVEAAGTAVATLDGSNPSPDGPSCTLVAAYVADGEVTVGWVGDSRAYWLAGPAGRLLTRDHSWAAEVVAEGLMDEATAFADRRAHTITRWLGPDARPDPDVVSVPHDGVGTLLVCSDGLWNEVPEAERIGGFAAGAGDGATPLAVANRLTEVALAAGGRDNISVVVIPLEGVQV
ncbi:PP2C family serine/threonine-protein phosphatase [Saccharothrix sp. Mg75]|uniref:PP2C family serine/threonine-protein phosphatase n=1 Tax=Saccharothrix sp. Mg75 TaxID=3445357 RepID=UPI003EED24A3